MKSPGVGFNWGGGVFMKGNKIVQLTAASRPESKLFLALLILLSPFFLLPPPVEVVINLIYEITAAVTTDMRALHPLIAPTQRTVPNESVINQSWRRNPLPTVPPAAAAGCATWRCDGGESWWRVCQVEKDWSVTTRLVSCWRVVSCRRVGVLPKGWCVAERLVYCWRNNWLLDHKSVCERWKNCWKLVIYS